VLKDLRCQGLLTHINSILFKIFFLAGSKELDVIPIFSLLRFSDSDVDNKMDISIDLVHVDLVTRVDDTIRVICCFGSVHDLQLDGGQEVEVFDQGPVVSFLEIVCLTLLLDDILRCGVHVSPEHSKIGQDCQVQDNCDHTSKLGTHLVVMVSFLCLPVAPMQK
jgi:hypothetical protein